MISNPKSVWEATRSQLQIQMSENTFNSWVKDTEFQTYERGIFVISTPNAYAKDWLENRLYRQIYRALNSLSGELVELRFSLRSAPQATPEAQAPKHPVLLLPPAESQKPKTDKTEKVEKVETPPIFFAQGMALNPDYLLSNFQVGPSNHMAHTAASAIVNEKNTRYNPLYIHGGVGMGKTHLLHALGNAFQERAWKVQYVSAETFINDLVKSIRSQQTEAFRQFYRTPKVLLVDDIQFLAGKESSQQEFYHTFNMLYNQNCHIILAGNLRPQDIKGLDECLKSRFSSGLVVELNAPDTDTRLAILHKKAAAQDVELTPDVARLIAQKVRDNIRSLEGALNHVLAHAALTRQPLTLALAKELLKSTRASAISTEEQQIRELESVLNTTAQYHQMSLDTLLSKQRSQDIALARHLAIYLAREEMKTPLPLIGRYIGGRSHSTVINSCRKVEEKLKKDAAFRATYNQLRHQVLLNRPL